ncbi:MAG: hypothetical protein EZS28_027875 [Streblomastix strix]|uniref:Uncharacterized protein n=1 Tax=Streblomastix strix TaxID=222440 RepID=A0A5J4V2H6_9EUKA|nr:MAG: hypothetical protein EZS28_027875 [Streblomastix strix]
MTIYSRDEESGSFEFIDHQKIYQQVFSVHCIPQSHSVDCLLIVTVNGEWLFLQWHESNFFPLGTGSLLDAVQHFFSKPVKRRFRLDPVRNILMGCIGDSTRQQLFSLFYKTFR